MVVLLNGGGGGETTFFSFPNFLPFKETDIKPIA